MIGTPSGTVSESLSSSDQLAGPRGAAYYFDDYEFEATAGAELTIETTSGSFDTFIYVLDGDCQILDSDDDGSTGTLSLIDFRVPSTGIYTVVVTSFGQYVRGSYTLSVSERDSVGTLCGEDDVAVESATGSFSETLTQDDAVDGPRGSDFYYDDYEFYADEGDTILLATTAASFDTYLYLLDQNCTVIGSDDDSGDSTLSLINMERAPASQIYTAVVTSYSRGTTGSYALSVNAGAGCTAGACCYSPSPTIFDGYTEGELSPSDPADGPHGSSYYRDSYEFVGVAGTSWWIEVTQADFDTYFYLLDQDCTLVATDDDSAGDLRSLLHVTFSETARYTLVVTSYSARAGGFYTLYSDLQ